jgi:hypothetical protein
MPREGYISITVKEEVYNKARELWKAQNNGKSFVTWLFDNVFEHSKLLSATNKTLMLLLVDENAVYLKDLTIKRMVEVVFDGKGKYGLFCNYCNKDDCIHVGFVLSVGKEPAKSTLVTIQT